MQSEQIEVNVANLNKKDDFTPPHLLNNVNNRHKGVNNDFGGYE